jgi:undecaprenyl diphosphate synthase
MNEIAKAEQQTAHNTAFQLNVALSYGSRQEIIKTLKHITTDIVNGNVNADDIGEALINDKLYTSDIPDPDLLIRTGGEQRLSNFLLWQSAYTELYFTPTLWPDFSPDDFDAALAEYATRERRYGKRHG